MNVNWWFKNPDTMLQLLTQESQRPAIKPKLKIWELPKIDVLNKPLKVYATQERFLNQIRLNQPNLQTILSVEFSAKSL